MTDPAVTQKPHSASSLKLYQGCPRRWVFERLYGFVEEDTRQKSLGTAVHKLMEEWIKDGKLPKAEDGVASVIALKLLSLFKGNPYYPGKGTTEAEEHFAMTIAGVKWHGYTDFRRQKVIGSREHIVGDWKTSNDLKYALREEKGLLVSPEGGADPQATLYATREFVEGAMTVTGYWSYCQSKAPYTPRLVTVNFGRSATEDAYGVLHGHALEMNQLYSIRPKANDVPYRTGYCNAFNKPCSQAERCNRPRGVFISEPLNLDSYEPPKDQTTMQNFLDAIRASAPSTVEDDAPPPPPMDDDEAPPAPPEEEDAPPPPPKDEELEAELLVQEYMASKRAPRPAPTEAEAGFVNAPEAKGKRPYATPEEAVIGEGVAFVYASPADALRPNDRHGLVVQEGGVSPSARLDVVQEMVGEGHLSSAGASEITVLPERLFQDATESDAKPSKTRKARAKKADKAANFVADPETMAKVPVTLEAPGIVCGYNFNDPQDAYKAFELALDPTEPAFFTAEPELVSLPTQSDLTEAECVVAREEFAASAEDAVECTVRRIVQSELKAYFLEMARGLVAVLEAK